MLKKKYRLKKYSAIIATYKNNNTVSDSNICVYFGREKIDLSTPTKFAFIVSKKIHKRAVIRNRIKRLIREALRQKLNNSEYFFTNKYMSIIFSAKSDSIKADFKSISESLTNLLKSKI